MLIKSIEMRDFMSHKKTRVDLPERGIVVVSGPNGAGKSSLVEAVSVALWGKALRSLGSREKFSPWNELGKGSVSVETDKVSITRPAKGRAQWSTPGVDRIKFENATKSQAELEKIILPQDVWSRIAVFSSADATQFTLATDAERKRLLEVLLGLDALDEACARCRVSLKASEARLADAQSAISRLEFEIPRLEESLRDLDTMRESSASLTVQGERVNTKNAPVLLKNLRDQLEHLDEAKSRRAKIEDDLHAASQDVFKLEMKIKVKKTPGASTCPTCGSALRPEKIDKKEIAKLGALLEEAEAKVTSLSEKLSALPTVDEADLEADRRVLARWIKNQQDIEERRIKALSLLEDKHDLLSDARLRAKDLSSEVQLLKCTEKALGVGGVRSHILHGALAGIEQVVNMWLSRLSSAGDFGMSVSLLPYKEKVSGGVTDAISLKVLGVANDQGYLGASQGERRRIDASFVLALSEIAAGASGVDPGTLFFDEAFDSLDEEGQDAVCEVLKELSQDRCIVVITHRTRLRQTLRKNGAYWLKVEGGKLCASK